MYLLLLPPVGNNNSTSFGYIPCSWQPATLDWRSASVRYARRIMTALYALDERICSCHQWASVTKAKVQRSAAVAQPTTLKPVQRMSMCRMTGLLFFRAISARVCLFLSFWNLYAPKMEKWKIVNFYIFMFLIFLDTVYCSSCNMQFRCLPFRKPNVHMYVMCNANAIT